MAERGVTAVSDGTGTAGVGFSGTIFCAGSGGAGFTSSAAAGRGGGGRRTTATDGAGADSLCVGCFSGGAGLVADVGAVFWLIRTRTAARVSVTDVDAAPTLMCLFPVTRSPIG